MTEVETWRTGTLADPRLTYLEYGPSGGPLVLCVHGFPDIPGSFRELMQAFGQAGYRAVAPWLRGYAPSTLEGPFHVGQIADDILALADGLSPREPVVLVGHDWGAVATYGALGIAPWRFRAGITLAIPHPMAFLGGLWRDPKQWRRSQYMGFFQWRGASDRKVRAADYRYIEALWAKWSPGWAPPPGHLQEVRACLEASLPAPLEYYRALLKPSGVRAVHRLWSKQRKSPIPVPTLHLHGERDGCVGPEVAQGQRRFFSGAFRSVTLEGCGHWLHMERPQEIWRQMELWLNRYAPAD